LRDSHHATQQQGEQGEMARHLTRQSSRGRVATRTSFHAQA